MYMLWLLAWWFCGTPDSGSGCVFDSFACSWDLFPPIGFPSPTSIKRLLPYLIVSRFVVFGCHLSEACSFLKRKQRGSGPGGTVLRGVEGGANPGVGGYIA